MVLLLLPLLIPAIRDEEPFLFVDPLEVSLTQNSSDQNHDIRPEPSFRFSDTFLLE